MIFLAFCENGPLGYESMNSVIPKFDFFLIFYNCVYYLNICLFPLYNFFFKIQENEKEMILINNQPQQRGYNRTIEKYFVINLDHSKYI